MPYLSQCVVGHSIVSSVSVRPDVVPDRLGDSIKEQSDTDATGEEHEEPSHVVVLRNVVILAKFYAGVLGKVEPDEEDGPQILGADVEPSENISHPCLTGKNKAIWSMTEIKIACMSIV